MPQHDMLNLAFGYAPALDLPVAMPRRRASPGSNPPAAFARGYSELPAWQPEPSLCSRCLETYEAAAAQELAATT